MASRAAGSADSATFHVGDPTRRLDARGGVGPSRIARRLHRPGPHHKLPLDLPFRLFLRIPHHKSHHRHRIQQPPRRPIIIYKRKPIRIVRNIYTLAPAHGEMTLCPRRAIHWPDGCFSSSTVHVLSQPVPDSRPAGCLISHTIDPTERSRQARPLVHGLDRVEVLRRVVTVHDVYYLELVLAQ